MDTITIEEYYKMLTGHDWYYSFSDSASVYRAGEKSWDNISKIAAYRGGVFDIAFHAFSDSVSSTIRGKSRERPTLEYILALKGGVLVKGVRLARREFSERVYKNVELINGERHWDFMPEQGGRFTIKWNSKEFTYVVRSNRGHPVFDNWDEVIDYIISTQQ